MENDQDEREPSVLDTEDEENSNDLELRRELSGRERKLSANPIDKIVVQGAGDDDDAEEEDEDEEIQTSKNYTEEVDLEEDEEEELESAEEEEEKDRHSREGKFTARSIFLDETLRRAGRASDRLRTHLSGKMIFNIDNGRDRFLFDWSNPSLEVTELKEDGGEADCFVDISEENLVNIFKGHLNPQVSMLAGKVRVKGRSSFAVYFFNLLAPRGGGF